MYTALFFRVFLGFKQEKIMENNNRLIIIGRILGVHGIKGELKVLPSLMIPDVFMIWMRLP